MRAVEIHERLAAQVEAVAQHLLPNGRRVGHEWRVGGVGGEGGKSMGVHLGGSKPGVWLDGNTGESGDLVGLWMAVRGLSLHEACREALEYLGIRDDRPVHHAKTYRVPDKAGVARLSVEHAAWLRDVRKLPDASVEAYRLASRGERLMFPYLRDGALVFAKYRRLPKQFSADADCEPILFGWQAIAPDARAVVICEGELDALAWHAYGFPALSVPTGAGAHGWIEAEYDRLAVFDTIYLSMDMDAAGQKAITELVERLGRERTKVVTLPTKDANQCLIDGVPPETVTAVLRDARTLDPAELRNASEFADQVWAEFHRVDEGIALPWAKTRDYILLRAGEVSVWAGVNGHGKSTVVSHVVAHAATNGYRCCVASMEWRTPVWLMRMQRQIGAVGMPTETYSRHISESLRRTLWTFDVAGASKAERILDVFAYARKRYRIELFVIDNLTKCGFADDDYPGQKKFVEALADFARINDCHVMLVAHMRKGESEDRPGGKMGVKGSGGITDMVATLVEVWRNKARERALVDAERLHESVPAKYQPDGSAGAGTLLLVHKQNATGKEPAIRLWIDEKTTQFLGHAADQPRPMLPFAVATSNGGIAS